MKYKYNKNRLPTREKDIVEAIDIAAPTNNKGKEDDIVPVELVDQKERIQDGYGDGESVTIRFRMKYKYNKIDFRPWKRKATDTAAPTNDEQNKDLCIAVELDDTGGNGDGEEGPVIIRFRTDRY